MMIEKIIAKKDAGNFLNYTVVKRTGNVSNNLILFIDAIRSNVFKDILDYENSSKLDFSGWSSDEWNVEYGDKNKEYYLKLYDYFTEEDATDNENGSLSVDLNQINGLKIKSKENLFKLIDDWQLIIKNRPSYIIVSQDDKGWIHVDMSDNKID